MRVEIRPPAWKLGLGVAGILAFTVVGSAIAVYGDGLFERAAGVLAVVFFGGFCGYAFLRTMRGQGRLAIVNAGLEIGLPGTLGHVVPWRDIESISVVKIASAEFTAVRLSSYQGFLHDVSPSEAQSLLRLFQSLRVIGYSTVAVGAVNAEDVGELVGTLRGSEDVKSVAGYLAYNRRTFGAELLIAWHMRDRNATAFAAYLQQCRQKLQP